jgi:hypothetical protein
MKEGYYRLTSFAYLGSVVRWFYTGVQCRCSIDGGEISIVGSEKLAAFLIHGGLSWTVSWQRSGRRPKPA